MKKIRYLYVLLLFTIFVPKVYAFTYSFNVQAGNTRVEKGATQEIIVTLRSLQGTNSQFGACELNIELDETISLNGNVKALNQWNLTTSSKYTFDTSESFVKGLDMFSIPVKINGDGTVKITNIKCSDGNTEESIEDKSISFTIIQSDNNSEVDGTGDVLFFSSPNLAGIELSEGAIEFDPDITEYEVTVSDYEKLEVSVELEGSSSSYSINKDDDGENKTIVIEVISLEGDSKTYTINVTEDKSLLETEEVPSENNSTEEKQINYVPIFIGIIGVLVLINILRIVRSKKK